ncbi:amidohydrolase family protein [Lentisalinibacter sediminis]|uniref:amidohydrolase family protein n=1 Tax=Lentisalinibacter sediminis TaxID=2992237 RepID=UPI003865B008
MTRANPRIGRLFAGLCLAAALSVSVSAPAAGSDGSSGGDDTVAITGATVHTMGPQGTLSPAILLIENGRVAAVGTDVDIPAGARRIDATGKVITPGLFDPASVLGVEEISLEASTVDHVQRGERYTAAFAVAPAINPRSTLIAINRIEGVTRALVAPTSSGPDEAGVRSSVISGLGAVISLSGDPGSVTRERAALFARLGSAGGAVAFGSRAEALLRLESALRDAAEYADNTEAYSRGERRTLSVSAEDLEALQPVLAGDMPLVVDVERASDIDAVLALALEHGLRLVISGGSEAWMRADKLAAAGVPVILNPLANLPADFDRLEATLENAARLHEAEVTLVFSAGDSHNPRNITQAAGNAVAHGLPWHEGLRAITRAPAEVFGLGDELGAIRPGLAADLVVWDGDPLEVTSFPDQVFIDGAAVPMRSRQTLLRDRYRDPAGAPDRGLPPAYVRPWTGEEF